MSKRLIVYLVTIVGIIALAFGGIPYLQANSPAHTYDKKSQVHVIEGVYGMDLPPVKIGKFAPVDLKDLKRDHREFAKDMIDERGVFQKDEVVLLSLGVESPHKKITFVRQEIRANEVRIYVKVEEGKTDGKQEEPSYLLGKIALPPFMPLSFIDEKTGSLLY
ncbi:hypothetical protein ACFVS2_22210 [Brevibacillus sp. NPDC058079]|uniref:hypothetical protein n=1 Tax=Brevibacillus sp. NPDC058079 TaxID=3346330 RepID=UPI0036E9E425